MKNQVVLSFVATFFAVSVSLGAVGTEVGETSPVEPSMTTAKARPLVAPDIKVKILPQKMQGDKRRKLTGDKVFPSSKLSYDSNSKFKKLSGDKIFPNRRALTLKAKAEVTDPAYLALERILLESDEDYRVLRESWIELVREGLLSKDAFQVVNKSALEYYAHLRSNTVRQNIRAFILDLSYYQILLEDEIINDAEFAWLVSGLFNDQF